MAAANTNKRSGGLPAEAKELIRVGKLALAIEKFKDLRSTILENRHVIYSDKDLYPPKNSRSRISENVQKSSPARKKQAKKK